MDTLFASSPDGTCIAYDRCGTGQAIVLIPGGGGSRQEWHEAGYVDRLREEFTLISIDLRGHGQSDLPTDPADFRCPTVWLAGSEDQYAVDSIKEYENALVKSQVQVHVVDGLDHSQSFDKIDTVLPVLLAFTRE